MGRRTQRESKSFTLPPSPSHSFSSSSSSDFEFTISISPRKSSTVLCPADELFYKGQLLPLHLSPRISMVRTILLSSSSSTTTSSSSPTNGCARDSTGSSNDSHSSLNSDLALFPPDCDSSRPSSVTEDDEFRRLHNPSCSSQGQAIGYGFGFQFSTQINNKKTTNKYFSLSRFSSVFRKENGKTRDPDNATGSSSSSSSSVKRMSASAKEVIRKYLKKVKPLYEKLSQSQRQQQQRTRGFTERSIKETEVSDKNGYGRKDKEPRSVLSHSFSGNLMRYPRRRTCVSSCPSSMRSSPSHSGVLSRSGFAGGGMCYGDASSMEELQSAIQGAIAHCKNSLIQNKTMVSNEI